jgi:deoxycytidylate deaminase
VLRHDPISTIGGGKVVVVTAQALSILGKTNKESGQSVIEKSRTKEIFFAVVGPVGAGGSRVVQLLAAAAESAGYKTNVIKASDCIRECLSRQVGAALVDSDGTVIATGTNEVPKAGGGIYGEMFTTAAKVSDHRCAFMPGVERPFCSNNHQQNEIISELIRDIPELSLIEDKTTLSQKIRKTRLGQLIEFSRAVHAEMDAIISRT